MQLKKLTNRKIKASSTTITKTTMTAKRVLLALAVARRQVRASMDSFVRFVEASKRICWAKLSKQRVSTSAHCRGRRLLGLVKMLTRP
jgi:hypothetical protein